MPEGPNITFLKSIQWREGGGGVDYLDIYKKGFGEY